MIHRFTPRPIIARLLPKRSIVSPTQRKARFRLSNSALKIWENPNPGMQGRPHFQVRVFPDQNENKIISLVADELHVAINVPQNQGNATLLPFLQETLGLSQDYKLVINQAYRRKRRKWIRIQKVDGQPIPLSFAVQLFSHLQIGTQELPQEPPHPEQPK